MPMRGGPTERFHRSVLPMVMVLTDGRVKYVNDVACRLLGRPREQLLSRGLDDWWTGEQGRSDWRQALRAADAGEPGDEFAALVEGPDGAPVSCRITWSLMLDGQGRPSYLSVVIIDESDRVQAQQQVQAMEARWRALLVSTADAIWRADAEGRLLEMVTPLPAQLGWDPVEMVGSPLYDFVHSDDHDDVVDAFRRLVTGGERRSTVECRLVGRTGGQLWATVVMTDLRDDPHVGAIVGNVVDISAVKREQQAALATAQQYQARFHQSLMPQAVIDLDGTLSEVNDALCELLGRSRTGLLGETIFEQVHPEAGAPLTGETALVLAGRLATARVEGVAIGPGGDPLPLSVDLSMVRSSTGAPQSVIAYVRDQTLLRETELRRRRAEDFYTALETLGRGLSAILDGDGLLVYLSPSAEQLLGRTVGELQEGLGGLGLIHVDDRSAAERVLQQVLAGGGPLMFEARVEVRDGRLRWISYVVTDMRGTAIGGVALSMLDVTHRRQAQIALETSEARFRAIADTAGEGIWTVDADGATRYANDRTATLLGVPVDDLRQGQVPEQVQTLARHLAGHIGQGRHAEELSYEHPDGSPRCFQLTSNPLPGPDGSIEGVLGMLSDVTDARDVEEQLRHAALHDGLTGLANKTLLLDRLGRALAQSNAATSVLSLDLDRFQQYNESRGHRFGDRVLVAVAAALCTAVRPQDTVARMGDDEFVVLCEQAGQAVAAQVAHGLLAALAQVRQVDGHDVHLEASIGLAVSPGSADDLLRFADTALRAAKGDDAVAVRVFEPILATVAQERYDIAAVLRSALHDGGLSLHYQPIVDLRTGATAGVEALSRWRGPGAVPPSVFVAVAESAGLAGDLDRWVLRQALTDAAVMRADGVIPAQAYVAINLCVSNLCDAGFGDFVRDAVAESDLPPDQVVLEITESAIMADPRAAIELLGKLRSLGLRLAVDDFGTGYSSLAYLRDLPVTTLKIDRSFVTDLAASRDALAIAASIVELARAVGLEIVAEGIETREQLDLLRGLGCHYGQGWLWSRAEPPATLRERPLAHHRFEV